MWQALRRVHQIVEALKHPHVPGKHHHEPSVPAFV